MIMEAPELVRCFWCGCAEAANWPVHCVHCRRLFCNDCYNLPAHRCNYREQMTVQCKDCAKVKIVYNLPHPKPGAKYLEGPETAVDAREFGWHEDWRKGFTVMWGQGLRVALTLREIGKVAETTKSWAVLTNEERRFQQAGEHFVNGEL